MPLFNQVFEVFITSVTIVLKVILMAILGILLRRFNILTEDTMSSLSKVFAEPPSSLVHAFY